MEFQKFADTFVVRLDKGEEIIASLQALCEKEKIAITSLLGNITQKDGAVYLHLHINLCNKEMQILGGHLNECRIGATGEIVVRTLPGKVERLLDEKVTGLNLFKFV